MVGHGIKLSEQLYAALVGEVRRRHPQKSFGYLISDIDPLTPTDFVFFEGNARNSAQWRGKFEAYGDYYREHSDAGFVAPAEEAWRLQKEIWARNMFEVGVFHSHNRHPANFSKIDFEMHVQRFDDLWHMLVSVRNPNQPVVRAFTITASGVGELPIHLASGPSRPERFGIRQRDEAVALARRVLAVDGYGRPRCRDASAVWAAVEAVRALGDAGVTEEFLGRGLLKDAAERYERHVAADMRTVPATRFFMGTDPDGPTHTYDESPRHLVHVSRYRIGRRAVTNELYALLDPDRAGVPKADRRKPVTGVSWTEAAVFALWMGARLPSEAEWEFACGMGSADPWCCATGNELPRYAWYCKNSGGTIHPVGTRDPNRLGLYDLHGNVWEWCHDSYHSRFYAGASRVDPVCVAVPADRVTRGGSMHSHADMCRNSYRSHEPVEFRAGDLGFRLANGREITGEGTGPW
jgi:formylglycine-generating enzyme required for sulfatase activity/proteasome lid subunit RPN8/RPN11